MFITNILIDNAEETIVALMEQYSLRWCIETGYRVIKGNMAKTRSNSPGLRMLLFIMSVVLYNLWRTARFEIETGVSKAYSGNKNGLKIRLFMWRMLAAEKSFVVDRGK